MIRCEELQAAQVDMIEEVSLIKVSGTHRMARVRMKIRDCTTRLCKKAMRVGVRMED